MNVSNKGSVFINNSYVTYGTNKILPLKNERTIRRSSRD